MKAGSRTEFRLVAYLLIVTTGLGATFAASLCTRGIFSCQAQGYSDNRYLAYCAGSRYGDYDHGAFWFDLEPAAARQAGTADVVFLGNSRLQVALSTSRTDEWFRSISRNYYLLGFMFNESMQFSNDVLDKLKPAAELYVINIDDFFNTTRSGPAQSVVTEPDALERYREKRRWQIAHRVLCGSVPILCGDKEAYFRSISTGSFVIRGDGLVPGVTKENPVIDEVAVHSQVSLAEPFLASLGVPRSCIVFTLAPHHNAQTATSNAVAEALGIQFVSPRLGELTTVDSSHLDPSSADRWSAEFFRLAGPLMKACLGVAGSQE